MACEHFELTCDGFGRYHYCIRCEMRVHTVMNGYLVVKFIPCMERQMEPKGIFYEDEKNCNCELKVNLKPNEHLV